MIYNTCYTPESWAAPACVGAALEGQLPLREGLEQEGDRVGLAKGVQVDQGPGYAGTHTHTHECTCVHAGRTWGRTQGRVRGSEVV
jgi:hypothetical protein